MFVRRTQSCSSRTNYFFPLLGPNTPGRTDDRVAEQHGRPDANPHANLSVRRDDGATHRADHHPAGGTRANTDAAAAAAAARRRHNDHDRGTTLHHCPADPTERDHDRPHDDRADGGRSAAATNHLNHTPCIATGEWECSVHFLRSAGTWRNLVIFVFALWPCCLWHRWLFELLLVFLV